MRELDEERSTVTGVIAFEGEPALSTSSTLTVPVSARLNRLDGETKTLRIDGNPLGVSVVSRANADARPCDDAVTVVEPGVGVVTALTTTYSLPAGIVTVFGTDAMLVWEEVRYTVRGVRAAEGRPFESTSETTTAGYVPLSAGSFGGIIVSERPTARDGTLEVTATEKGMACDTRRSDTTATSTVPLTFNLATSLRF
jgi:hypothetical protein